MADSIRLTQMTKSAGWAAKIGPGVLSDILKKLPRPFNENLLVGFDTSDDASVYRINDDIAMIQTVDFFPPMVDDPYQFGQIAAANALSDVYAMGGNPVLALNILCFPNCLPLDVLQEILAGGYKKVEEAGAVIAGGHSVEDDEPKYGLCVSGLVHPKKYWTNSTAQEGDVLFLTKPLGSGILNTAAKAQLLTPEDFKPAVETMSSLNKYAKEAAEKVGLNSCTDITGFGLLGHSCEMAEGSKKTIRLFADKIPVLPMAKEQAQMGIIPGGAYKNRDHFGKRIKMASSIPQDLQDIMFDPQTSGGLLISVDEKSAVKLSNQLKDSGVISAIIGQVIAKGNVDVEVE